MTARIEDLGDRIVVHNTTTRRGALTPEFYTVLGQATALAAQPRITAVIIHGQGYFCAGGDLGQLASRRELSHEGRIERIEALHTLIRGIMDCPVPVIAAVEGGAAGAGMSLAFACDLIVADRDATFSAAYVKAGLVPDGGLTASLARHVPRATLMRLALFGEAVTAQRLHDLGAVSQLEDRANVLPAAMSLADRLATGPARVQSTIKSLVSAAYACDPLIQMDAERDAMAHAVAAPEAGEGIAAFLEKRPAAFASLRDES